jgi:hypothetical protein
MALTGRVRILKAVVAVLTVASAILAVGSAQALATKGAIALYGGTAGTQGLQFSYQPGGLAINQNGTGGASPGDVYVVDTRNHRVQQLSASGQFIRAFGLDVGGSGVEVCTEAAACAAGTASGAAGGMNLPRGIAIEQATGNVFVLDVSNHRIDVFSATGVFEGAFGWNVMAVGGAEELQFCTSLTGCKAGTAGFGAGQMSAIATEGTKSAASSPLNGHLIVSNVGASRIDEFAPVLAGESVTGVSFVRGYGWGVADGADEFQHCTSHCQAAPEALCEAGLAPGQFGTNAPGAVVHRPLAVDNSGNVYVAEFNVQRIQKFSPEGQLLAPLLEPASACGPTGDSKGFIQLGFDGATGNFTAVKLATVYEVPERREVIEYNAAGESIDEFLSPVGFPAGLAVNESTGVTYLSERTVGEGVVQASSAVITLGNQVPPVASIAAPTEVDGTTATFLGQVNPEGLFTNFHFEYSSDGVNWTPAHDKQEEEEINAGTRSRRLPADSSNHAVEQKAEGLEALTQYHLRLIAVKEFGGGEGRDETTFTTVASPPVVTVPTPVEVSDTSLRLEAAVNPENEATGYRFQCVSQADFEASEWARAVEQPPGGGTLAAGGGSVTVAAEFAAMPPGTSYRCRVLAENATGAVAGQAVTVTTYVARTSGLPDARVYEQATPVQKNGADARGAPFLVKAAGDGNAITYYIAGGGNVGEGGQEFPTYVATRSAESWRSYGLLPPARLGARALVSGWSEGLQSDYTVARNPGSSTAFFYQYDPSTGSARQIFSGSPNGAGERPFAAEGAEGGMVLFESELALVEGAHAGKPNLYLWNRARGEVSLVSVLPNGTPSPTGAFAGPYMWATSKPAAGGAEEEMYLQSLHVLSADGGKAFFTTSNVNQVYVREGLGGSAPHTVQVSASQKANGSGANGHDPHGPQKATFMEATPNGRYAFFTSPEELTNDATTGAADEGNDLYRFDTATGTLMDLAPDIGDAEGAEVQALLGASADGSYAYFVANGVLASGASAGNCTDSAVTGLVGSPSQRCNLYLWHEGTIEFIGRLRGGGQGDGDVANWIPAATLSGAGMPMKTASVSGDSLLFTTPLSLTSYDNAGLAEVYRFDPVEGLQCVSCNPTGATARLPASLHEIDSGFAKPQSPQPFVVRNLTDGGRRVFFETAEKLLATDDNGVRDVYEWEADGTGSCTSATQNGGCLYLISSRSSTGPSYFADASETGDDVFFFTRQSLVGQDKDELMDVYDARVGGGIASQNPEAPSPCDGEGCRGAPASPPISPSAGSASFAGPGNANHKHKKKKHKKKKHHHKKKHKHHKHKKKHRRASERGAKTNG